jgi:alpha-L-fucosidase 2
MKINVLKIILLTYLFTYHPIAFAQQKNILWYDKPAANWNEALPIGNGFIGAMIFGSPQQERLQLNESTIWGGGPNNTVDAAAGKYIDSVRILLSQKKYEAAQLMANKYITPKGNSGMPYQLAGNLYINFPGHDQTTNYYRDLNIDNATASVTYTNNGVHYKREYFTSFTNNILIVRLSADKPGMITCQVNIQSPLKQTIRSQNGGMIMSGLGSDHENQKGKVKFNVVTRVKTAGGSASADSTSININKTDTAIIYVSIASNFVNYHNLSADPYARADSILNRAFPKSFSALLDSHTAFYKRYFNRVKLDLGLTDAAKNTTDIRIKNFAKGNDPQLAELYFQFGRYLLICSSQPGSQPANLQGIWNGDLKGAWDSKYTININTEMNYWPSETTQLSELSTPLFNLVNDVSVTGKETAHDMYGAQGWVMHHNTDIWRITGIVDGPFWGLWPTGNAWLCQHVWDHYLFTGDKNFLKKYYPVMKGAAAYFIDVLQPEDSHNWLVVSPSVSPEHEYMTKGRTQISITSGATMDNQLVYGLFTNLINAANDLKIDKPFVDSLKNYRDRLPPMQIGKFGQLQEWLDDWDSPTDNHRHVSHLYGMFPGNQVSPFRSPELFAAAKNSLIYRGDVSTGWSMAWKINLWARLLDGNHAYKLISDQISPVASGDSKGMMGGGGTYPNLFDAHPPFQIDGNFGCTSGITEMLMQSYDGDIYVLPALPDAWQKGSVTGLMARGGFKVDMAWEKHHITRLVIHSTVGGNCRIRLNQVVNTPGLKTAKGINPNPLYVTVNVKSPIIKQNDKDLRVSLPKSWMYDLKTEKGKTYVIIGSR